MNIWNNLTEGERDTLTEMQRRLEQQHQLHERRSYWEEYVRDPMVDQTVKDYMNELADYYAGMFTAIRNKIIEINNNGKRGRRSNDPIQLIYMYHDPKDMAIFAVTAVLGAYLSSYRNKHELKQMDEFKNSLFSNLARTIGNDLMTSMLFKDTRTLHRGMFKAWQASFKNWDKRKIDRFNKMYAEVEGNTRAYQENIGCHILSVMRQYEGPKVAPYFRHVVQRTESGKEMHYVIPSDEMLAVLCLNHEDEQGPFNIAALVKDARKFPTLCPPADHTMEENGGMILPILRKGTVRIRGRYKGVASKVSQRNLDVINELQRTEWTINDTVFRAMEHLWVNNINACNLPARTKEMTFIFNVPKPKDGTKEQIKAWNAERHAAHTEWNKNYQKRARMEQRLGEARNKRQNRMFYHCWHFDFRGRMYTSADTFSPQGSDLDCAMIKFATPYEIHDEETYREIAINLTNLFDGQGPEHGFQGTASDKSTLDERYQWAVDNIDQFRTIVANPVHPDVLHMWEDTSPMKNVSFQRLAAAEDFLLATDKGLTAVPVQVDGTCNGYQHWAALMRDHVTGPHVNLQPLDTGLPGDLYKVVAEGMDTVLGRYDGDDPYMQAFKVYYAESGVPRKATKRCVMCDPYGLTAFSMKAYIRVEGHLDWIDTFNWNSVTLPDDFEPNKNRAIVAFTNLLQAGLREVNGLSEQGKIYVKTLCDIAGTEGYALCWTTPSGFTVANIYKESLTRTDRLSLFLKGKARKYENNKLGDIRRSMPVEGTELDVAGCIGPIPPNYIHSIDAAHLSMVVERMMEAGCHDFSMIHDSFGCPAPFAAMMRKIIKETFYEIHAEPLLDGLKRQVEEQLGIELPEPPTGGDLDILRVLESEYLFS